MAEESISVTQVNFADVKSSFHMCSIKNLSTLIWNYEVGTQFEFYRSKVSSGEQECTLTLALYPGGYEHHYRGHVAICASIDREIQHKIVIDLALCDAVDSKEQIVLTKANYSLEVIKNFATKTFLNSLVCRLNDNVLRIACHVIVCGERKPVPDASLLRNAHFENYGMLFGNEDFSDFKLNVGDTTFKVHRCILATHSRVFAAMFRHDMSEKNQGSTDVPDVDVEVMNEFLRFIYTGKVEKLDELAPQLWIVADKYEVNGLKEISEGKLIERLNGDTVIETFCLLDKLNMSKLKSAAIGYVMNNAEQMKSDKKFEDTLRKLSSDLLTDVLCAALGKSSKCE